MIGTKGTVVAVNGNMVSVRFDGVVSMNEVGYVKVADSKLRAKLSGFAAISASCRFLKSPKVLP